MRLWKGLVAALAINGQGQELRALFRYLTFWRRNYFFFNFSTLCI